MEDQTYHNPVMLQECIDAMAIEPDGTYVDVTFGGGGHSRLILEQLGPKGRLLAFDQDEDAVENCPTDDRFSLLPFNFRYFKQSLRLERVKAIDAVLADLGISSHQIDTPERGFSFRFDADLDMRMNQQGVQTAADIVNSYTAEELQSIFGQYGEVRNARTLAQTIVQGRSRQKIERVDQFLTIIEPVIKGKKNRYLSQVFQALRMEVNDEIGALKDMLKEATEMLKPGGRLVVLSYHSLEDRLVKNWVKNGTFEKEPEKDLYGRFYKPLKAVNRKPILPSDQEIKDNPRARSAKLRVAVKLDTEE
jgi:16S rRNA (cytosine1402-N4)-methyltransferase